jgi:predicted  nucleic acid-binding Zn-ribbon protein
MGGCGMSNIDLANKLLALKKNIRDVESEKIKLEAKLETLLEQLKKETGSDDLDKAKKELEAIDGRIRTLQKELDDGVEALEEKYDL